MDGPRGSTPTSTLSPAPDDFHIKGAAARAHEQGHAEPECCSICLEAITERAIASPCNHLSFDFICLVQWLQEHSSCPLCKARINEVQYDWRGPTDFKTFRVAQVRSHEAAEAVSRAGIRSRQRSRSRQSQPTNTEDPSLKQRRAVYDHRMFSLHIGSNRYSGYRNITAAEIRSSTESAELQSRARTFLRRELRVFGFLDDGRVRNHRGASRDFLVEYVVAILKTNDAKAADGHAEALISDFLGRDHTKLLLHEVDAWLRSPYSDLATWDSHVQYSPVVAHASNTKVHGYQRP